MKDTCMAKMSIRKASKTVSFEEVHKFAKKREKSIKMPENTSQPKKALRCKNGANNPRFYDPFSHIRMDLGS